MFYKLGVNLPIVGVGVSVMSWDPKAPERDHATTMGSEGADLVRDAGKPSASLYRAGALDRLLETPSPLDDLLGNDTLD
jgi:hypothetical protein